MDLIFGLLFFLFSNIHEKTNLQLSSTKKSIGPKQTIPCVQFKKISGKPCDLHLFFPILLNIQLCDARPDKTDANYLCVPAAFTQLINNKIDGVFIVKGKEIGTNINTTLTGACILSSEKIEIIGLKQISPELKNKIIKNKKSLFQQTLLVQNKKAYAYKTLPTNKFKRRALIEIDGTFCIAETEKAISISEFQNLLVSVGAINAIYLDMGSWSEGWYKNEENKIVTIGENMSNTKRQSNWIVYSHD